MPTWPKLLVNISQPSSTEIVYLDVSDRIPLKGGKEKKKEKLSTLSGANEPEDNIWGGEDDDKTKPEKTNEKKPNHQWRGC